MHIQKVKLGDGKILEIKVYEKDDCITVTQQLISDGMPANSITCTVTSSTGKSDSWTCSGIQACSGSECSHPNKKKIYE